MLRRPVTFGGQCRLRRGQFRLRRPKKYAEDGGPLTDNVVFTAFSGSSFLSEQRIFYARSRTGALRDDGPGCHSDMLLVRSGLGSYEAGREKRDVRISRKAGEDHARTQGPLCGERSSLPVCFAGQSPSVASVALGEASSGCAGLKNMRRTVDR